VRREGLEPPTYGLRVRHSAIELAAQREDDGSRTRISRVEAWHLKPFRSHPQVPVSFSLTMEGPDRLSPALLTAQPGWLEAPPLQRRGLPVRTWPAAAEPFGDAVTVMPS
jgi:hypothetical protein